jgi:hypothetical protein
MYTYVNNFKYILTVSCTVNLKLIDLVRPTQVIVANSIKYIYIYVIDFNLKI